jgi:molecular chaperone DnaK
VPQVEVTFDIDANGIVHVSARDLGTGREQKIRIESSSGLAEEEIQRMVRDAESHAAEDRAEREKVETRNAAEGLAYSTEKSLGELGDRVAAADRQAVEEAIGELRAALRSDEPALVKGRMDALKKAAFGLSEQLYHEARGKATDRDGPRGEDPPGDAGTGGN